MNTNEFNRSAQTQHANHNLSSDIDSMSEEELKQLKRFLFEERIRIMQESEKQKEVYNKFINERLSFQEEMKALNRKVLHERKRLKDENSFFDKKCRFCKTVFFN